MRQRGAELLRAARAADAEHGAALDELRRQLAGLTSQTAHAASSEPQVSRLAQ